jgi:hypothetical protein
MGRVVGKGKTSTSGLGRNSGPGSIKKKSAKQFSVGSKSTKTKRSKRDVTPSWK